MTSIRYITSLLTFYLKGQIQFEKNLVRFKEPNTILGLIPLGSKNQSVAINQISSVNTNLKLKFGKLILGIVILIVSINLFKDSFGLGLIVLIIAANSIIDAFEIDLTLSFTSGQIKRIDFFIFEAGKAKKAEQHINNLISGRLDDTNTREQTDRIVDAIEKKQSL